MSTTPAIILELRRLYDVVSTGCACGIKQELVALLHNLCTVKLDDANDNQENLLRLTIIHTLVENSAVWLRVHKICPTILDMLITLEQKNIVKLVLDKFRETADNFTRHGCKLVLGSLAVLNGRMQADLCKLLCEQADNFDALPAESHGHYLHLIAYILGKQTKECHPDPQIQFHCPSSVASSNTLEESQLKFSDGIGRWWLAVDRLIKASSSPEPSYFVLELWLNILKHCPSTACFDGRSTDWLLEASISSCPILANLALDVLDESLRLVTTEVDLACVPAWVVTLCNKIMKVASQGWLPRLPYRDDLCGFGGTLRKQYSKPCTREGEAFLLGDSRMLRHVSLVLWKSSIVYLETGDPGTVLRVLFENFLWVDSKTLPTELSLRREDLLLRIFVDQDDQLVECLLTLLLLHLKLQDEAKPFSRLKTLEGPSIIPRPHLLFLYFLASLGNDHAAVMDLVISEGTCALMYLIRYLKLALSEWDAFVASHSDFDIAATNTLEAVPGNSSSSALDRTMATLIRLRMKLEKASQRGLLPFHVGPLVRLLRKCENLYEGG